ncbi:MAG: integrase core domain-containing protein, partial [Pseudonocardiaceae bacterium]
EGLLDQVQTRAADGLVDIDTDDESRPILLAVSDNGPQMTSGSTREFMALCAIAQHFGRPGTPTDQAWIESLNGHVKIEYPHLLAIRDPATLRAELAATREHYNGVRLHQGIGYVTPTTNTKDEVKPSARPARSASNKPGYIGLPPTAKTDRLNPTRAPTMLANSTPKCVTKSETRQISMASHSSHRSHGR